MHMFGSQNTTTSALNAEKLSMRLVEDHVLRDHLQANTKKGLGPSYGPVNGMLKSSTPPELTPNSN